MKLIIPMGTKTIRTGAYYKNPTVDSVEIPSTVKCIEDFAFYKCNNLKTIIFNGTQKQWDAIEKCIGWDMGTSCTIKINK